MEGKAGAKTVATLIRVMADYPGVKRLFRTNPNDSLVYNPI